MQVRLAVLLQGADAVSQRRVAAQHGAKPLFHLFADTESREFTRQVLLLVLFQLQPLQRGDHVDRAGKGRPGMIRSVFAPA